MFQNVAELYPDFRKKLVPVAGDLLMDNIGLSDEDERLIVHNVNVIFHSAATVRFAERLKTAVQMNVVGARKIVDLAIKTKFLEVSAGI